MSVLNLVIISLLLRNYTVVYALRLKTVLDNFVLLVVCMILSLTLTKLRFQGSQILRPWYQNFILVHLWSFFFVQKTVPCLGPEDSAILPCSSLFRFSGDSLAIQSFCPGPEYRLVLSFVSGLDLSGPYPGLLFSFFPALDFHAECEPIYY